MIRQTAIFDKFRILTVLLFIWWYCTIPRNGSFWRRNKRISLFFIALFSVFLRLVVIFRYKFVRWWQGKNQNFKKDCVNAKLGKWICGYGYPINKKHPRPFTLTAYRLAGVLMLPAYSRLVLRLSLCPSMETGGESRHTG